MTSGRTAAISASSQGRHALISAAFGFAVKAPLAAWCPLEVLHDVRDVDVVTRDPRGRQRAVEDVARPDERPARAILAIAGLLLDEHEWSFGRPSPNTVCVARIHRSHAWHDAAAARRAGSDRRARPEGTTPGFWFGAVDMTDETEDSRQGASDMLVEERARGRGIRIA